MGDVKSRVLVVDDDAGMCELVSGALTKRGYGVETRNTVEAGVAALDGGDFSLMLADLNLGQGDGLDLTRRALEKQPELPVVVFTAFGSMDAAVGAIRAGAYDFLTKPISMESLGLVVDRAIRHGSLSKEVQRLRRAVEVNDGFREIIGESPAIKRVTDLISRIASSDAGVLITGESGTGKELIARAIHERSERRGPFVALNCAAMPEQLLESELFGHVRGAFTDAKISRAGLFVEADGGTLLLDEIGEMPLTMQTKLLRALEERKVRPVGGTREVPFDARIVAATNKDLESEVAEGRFREDLFYRINVVRIETPPLRARGNDILLLAQVFLQRASERSGKAVTGMVKEAAEKLVTYPFPGNVRELVNAMERAVALARYDQLTVDDLPQRIREHTRAAPFVTSDDPDELLTMSELERRYIQRVLEATGGNKTRAAKILGFDRRTLYRKLER
jgi:two-component system response regulator HydG